MAVTREYLAALLESAGLFHQLSEDDPNSIFTGFKTESFTDAKGDQGIFIVIRLEEEGEYLKIYSPLAYKVSGPNRNAALQACMSIQWRTKLVQFEWDSNDGEIRPIVEWPIEDGSITERQLMRAIGGLASLVDGYDPVIRFAIERGEVDLSLAQR